MAGRGTDIQLGGDAEGLARDHIRRVLGQDPDAVRFDQWPPVWQNIYKMYKAQAKAQREQIERLGGLRVISLGRNKSRRIDRQLGGRAARNGDPGDNIFLVSMKDDMMRDYAPASLALIAKNAPAGKPLIGDYINVQIGGAQKRIQADQRESRERLKKQDEVLTWQRNWYYSYRRDLVNGGSIDMLLEEIARGAVKSVLDQNALDDEGRLAIADWAAQINPDLRSADWLKTGSRKIILEELSAAVLKVFRAHRAALPEGMFDSVARGYLKKVLDDTWTEYLFRLEDLKNTAGFRGDPIKALPQYKQEAHDLFFNDMIPGAYAEACELIGQRLRPAIGLPASPDLSLKTLERYNQAESRLLGFLRDARDVLGRARGQVMPVLRWIGRRLRVDRYMVRLIRWVLKDLQDFWAWRNNRIKRNNFAEEWRKILFDSNGKPKEYDSLKIAADVHKWALKQLEDLYRNAGQPQTQAWKELGISVRDAVIVPSNDAGDYLIQAPDLAGVAEPGFGAWLRVAGRVIAIRWRQLRQWSGAVRLKGVWESIRDKFAALMAEEDKSEATSASETEAPEVFVPQAEPASRQPYDLDRAIQIAERVAKDMSLEEAGVLVEADRLGIPITPNRLLGEIFPDASQQVSQAELDFIIEMIVLHAKNMTAAHRQTRIAEEVSAVNETTNLHEATAHVQVLADRLLKRMQVLNVLAGKEAGIIAFFGNDMEAAEEAAEAAEKMAGFITISVQEVGDYEPEALRTEEAALHKAAEVLGDRLHGGAWWGWLWLGEVRKAAVQLVRARSRREILGMRERLRLLVQMIAGVNRRMKSLKYGSEEKPIRYNELAGGRFSKILLTAIFSVLLLGGGFVVAVLAGYSAVFIFTHVVLVYASWIIPSLLVLIIGGWGGRALSRAAWARRVGARAELVAGRLQKMSQGHPALNGLTWLLFMPFRWGWTLARGSWKLASLAGRKVGGKKVILIAGSGLNALGSVQGLISKDQATAIVFAPEMAAMNQARKEEQRAQELLDNKHIHLTEEQKQHATTQKIFAQHRFQQAMLKMDVFSQMLSKRYNENHERLSDSSLTAGDRARIEDEQKQIETQVGFYRDVQETYDELARLGLQDGADANSPEALRLRNKLKTLQASQGAMAPLKTNLETQPQAQKDLLEAHPACAKDRYDDALFLKLLHFLFPDSMAQTAMTVTEADALAKTLAEQSDQPGAVKNNPRRFVAALAIQKMNRQINQAEDDYVHVQAIASIDLKIIQLTESMTAREREQTGPATASDPVNLAAAQQLNQLKQEKILREAVYQRVRMFKQPTGDEEKALYIRAILDTYANAKGHLVGKTQDSFEQLKKDNPALFASIEKLLGEYYPHFRHRPDPAGRRRAGESHRRRLPKVAPKAGRRTNGIGEGPGQAQGNAGKRD